MLKSSFKFSNMQLFVKNTVDPYIRNFVNKQDAFEAWIKAQIQALENKIAALKAWTESEFSKLRKELFQNNGAGPELNNSIIPWKNGGIVPLGGIIIWSSKTTTPDPAGCWLECNGQPINRSLYPEAYARIGTNTPNYSGMFIRGMGSQNVGGTTYTSGPLGAPQADAVLSTFGSGFVDTVTLGGPRAGGCFSAQWVNVGGARKKGNSSHSGCNRCTLDLSAGMNKANEIRPCGVAVRFFIRVKADNK